MLLLLCASGAYAADLADAETVASLKKLIVAGSAEGAKPTVYINFLGKPARVQIVGADDKGVNASSDGSVLPVGWTELTPDQFGGLASEYAKTGADYLSVARYFAQNKLKDHAEKAAIKAVEHDKSLTSEIGAIIGKDEPKPDASKVVAPVTPAAPGTSTAISNPSAEGEKPPPPKNNLAGLTGVASAPSGGTARIPDFKAPIMFDTPEADAIMSALQIFPKSNPWNQDVSKLPLLPESDKMVAHIGAEKHVFLGFDFSYIIVPADQPKIDVKLGYAAESDKGPYPVAPNTPIEGWPCFWDKKMPTLDTFQREGDGDRHGIVIDAASGMLYEFYQLRKTAAGAWTCANEATFDLKSNKQRPKNWTSADAAGLAMLPGLIRNDEMKRGVIEHAIRMTVTKTRKAFIYPATHHAGSTDDPTYPAMGQRFRLKASVDISSMPKDAQIIANALKKYGAIVADNGSDWYLCSTIDKRFNMEAMKAVTKFKGSDFEAVQVPDLKN